MQQIQLLPDLACSAPPLPLLGRQADISYHATRAKSVLNDPKSTGMGYWSINPYVGCAFGCAYCYARYTHRYVMERAAAKPDADLALQEDLQKMPPWLAFERHVVVKENAPSVLRKTLRQGSAKHLGLIHGEAVVIGTATDPYQPAERKYRITRGILEVLADHAEMKVVIITKSPLITRDIDLLTRIARNSKVSVHISLITLDRELARRLEPRAPTPESRLRALVRLRQAGIDAGVNCMPVLPGITDHPAALDALVKRVAESDATYIGACALRLQSAARQRYLPFIEQEFPHLAERYRKAYANGYQVSDAYREGLARFFQRLCEKYGVKARQYDVEDAESAIAEEQLRLSI
ncbi:MAG: radical SAM protein [Gemmatimonadota bacterium]|nr:radical SAM protein [Gemmatimonadota bacterium]